MSKTIKFKGYAREDWQISKSLGIYYASGLYSSKKRARECLIGEIVEIEVTVRQLKKKDRKRSHKKKSPA